MRRILIGAAAGVVLLLVLAQLLLPGIAASDLRDRLAKSGKVLSVSVSAFPAVELLWHDADKVVVRMATYQSRPGRLASLLSEAGGVGTLDASVGVLGTGLLTLHDARLRKRGNQLTGTASVSEADLRNVLPGVLQSVRPVSSGDGTLTLRGTATVPLLGGTVSADATVQAQSGNVVVSGLGGLASITVFSNPKIEVDSITGAAASGGLTVQATGRFR